MSNIPSPQTRGKSRLKSRLQTSSHPADTRPKIKEKTIVTRFQRGKSRLKRRSRNFQLKLPKVRLPKFDWANTIIHTFFETREVFVAQLYLGVLSLGLLITIIYLVPPNAIKNIPFPQAYGPVIPLAGLIVGSLMTWVFAHTRRGYILGIICAYLLILKLQQATISPVVLSFTCAVGIATELVAIVMEKLTVIFLGRGGTPLGRRSQRFKV